MIHFVFTCLVFFICHCALLGVCHLMTAELSAEHYSNMGLLLSSCSQMVSAEIPVALEVSCTALGKSEPISCLLSQSLPQILYPQKIQGPSITLVGYSLLPAEETRTSVI